MIVYYEDEDLLINLKILLLSVMFLGFLVGLASNHQCLKRGVGKIEVAVCKSKFLCGFWLNL